jgi:hypothetical protein
MAENVFSAIGFEPDTAQKRQPGLLRSRYAGAGLAAGFSMRFAACLISASGHRRIYGWEMGRASGQANAVAFTRRGRVDPTALVPQTAREELAARALHEARYAYAHDEISVEQLDHLSDLILRGDLRYQCPECKRNTTAMLARIVENSAVLGLRGRREARSRLDNGPPPATYTFTCSCGTTQSVTFR